MPISVLDFIGWYYYKDWKIIDESNNINNPRDNNI